MTQPVVVFVELRFFGILVAENFYYLQTVDVLFNITVERAYLSLLSYKVLSTLTADIFDDKQHNHKHHDGA